MTNKQITRIGYFVHWLAGTVIGILLLGTSLTGEAIPKFDPMTLASKISGDSSCVDYKIVGLCFHMGVPTGYMVNMYVPVAFLETVGVPGDTLVAAPSFSSMVSGLATQSAGMVGKVGQTHNSGMDNSSEANVWALPDNVMLLSPIQPKCMTCLPSDAVDAAVPFKSLPSTGCDATNVVTDRLNSMNSSMPSIPYFPRLAYSSSADPINWRTGCRDMALTNFIMSNPVNCTATSALDLMSKVGVDNPLRKYLGDYCLGAWGALYPRQMREVGNVSTVASAKTSYRAMHIAKNVFASVKFPVSTDGKLQQAYPNVSACFHPGDLPLPEAPLSAKPVANSTDGAFGWIYWRSVTCCVGFSSASKCVASSGKSN